MKAQKQYDSIVNKAVSLLKHNPNNIPQLLKYVTRLIYLKGIIFALNKPDVKQIGSSMGGGESAGERTCLKPGYSDSGKAEEYPPVDTKGKYGRTYVNTKRGWGMPYGY